MKQFTMIITMLMIAFSVQAQFELIQPIQETEVMNQRQMNLYQNKFKNWGIERLHLDSVMTSYTGKNVKICIADTGLPTHKDLTGKIKASANFSNDLLVDDANGHSTHVAGIINEIAPDAELYIAKVLSDEGSGSSDGVVQGVEWCIEQGVTLINMSLSSKNPYPPMLRTIIEGRKKGIVFITAAGNDGQSNTENRIGYPARYKETIAVGSIDKSIAVSDFSSSGENGDIVAPGESILSTFTDQKYIVLSGTSMAAPYITATTALFIQRNQIIHNLDTVYKKTAVDMLEPGYDVHSFNGHVAPRNMFHVKPPPKEEEPKTEDPSDGIKTPTFLKENWIGFAFVLGVVVFAAFLYFRNNKTTIDETS